MKCHQATNLLLTCSSDRIFAQLYKVNKGTNKNLPNLPTFSFKKSKKLLTIRGRTIRLIRLGLVKMLWLRAKLSIKAIQQKLACTRMETSECLNAFSTTCKRLFISNVPSLGWWSVFPKSPITAFQTFKESGLLFSRPFIIQSLTEPLAKRRPLSSLWGWSRSDFGISVFLIKFKALSRIWSSVRLSMILMSAGKSLERNSTLSAVELKSSRTRASAASIPREKESSTSSSSTKSTRLVSTSTLVTFEIHFFLLTQTCKNCHISTLYKRKRTLIYHVYNAQLHFEIGQRDIKMSCKFKSARLLLWSTYLSRKVVPAIKKYFNKSMSAKNCRVTSLTCFCFSLTVPYFEF